MRAFIVVLAVMLAGCSSLSDLKTDVSERLFGADDPNPPANLEDFKQGATANVAWHAAIGKSETYEFSPALDGKSVYAASEEGNVARLDAASGKPVWHIKTGERLSGGVGTGDNLVLVGTPSGFVLAFDQNGKALWKSKISSEVLSAPRTTGGVVVVRSGDSRIFGLDAADGKRKWVYERATPSLTLRSAAGVVVDGGVAYVGFAGGKLVALKADDGKVLWETAVAQPKGATEIERIADITSSPVVDGRLVYAVAYQGRVAAIDRTNGRVLWTRDVSSYTGLANAAGRVYVTHSGGAVYALDESGGKTYWRQGALLNRRLTAPVPVASLIAVGDLEGYLHFLAREDGGFVARIKTEGSPIMPRMLDLGNSTVLAQNRDGDLYAVNVK